MSGWHGRQYKGAAKDRKRQKRIEAEVRNERTLPERRRRERVRELTP